MCQDPIYKLSHISDNFVQFDTLPNVHYGALLICFSLYPSSSYKNQWHRHVAVLACVILKLKNDYSISWNNKPQNIFLGLTLLNTNLYYFWLSSLMLIKKQVLFSKLPAVYLCFMYPFLVCMISYLICFLEVNTLKYKACSIIAIKTCKHNQIIRGIYF